MRTLYEIPLGASNIYELLPVGGRENSANKTGARGLFYWNAKKESREREREKERRKETTRTDFTRLRCCLGFLSERIRRDGRKKKNEGGKRPERVATRLLWQINKSTPRIDLSFCPTIKRVSSNHSTDWRSYSTFPSRPSSSLQFRATLQVCEA